MRKRNQSNVMVTTTASQRITRLKSRETSAKAVPEKKLNPKRVANLKKVNTNNKSLHVSQTNVSLRTNQTSQRRLRPRRNRKNYCEDSRLLEQFILPQQQDSVVLIEKLHLRGNKKIPIYTAVELSEKSLEDKNNVYDFKFDLNDTREKAIKKLRKRNINKRKGKTIKKMTHKKVTTEAIDYKIIESSKTGANLSAEIAQDDSPLEFMATTSTKRDNMKKIKTLKTNKNIQTLMKTLSPIPKADNTLNFGSPWRPPTLTYSQTKHFIQSTPYKNFETKKENGEIKKSMEKNKESIELNKEDIEIQNKENIDMNKENIDMNKENIDMNKENIDMNKENIDMNKENIDMNKENIDMNKENRGPRNKERKKKIVSPHKKQAIQKKLLISKNQIPKKLQAAVSKSIAPAPIRVSLGEINNLLRSNNNINENNKQTVEQTPTEVDKSLPEEKKKQLVNVLNFSDTFDVLSETEKLSNIENDAPLFMDLEPSHFSKPPRHSYKRKRAVKFDFSEDDSDEEKEIVKLPPKKKKLTKSEKEQEKRINEWIKTVNITFQEIEEHDLLIES